MLRCVLRPHGRVFVSLPLGPDAVIFNAMRRYGPVRLPLLLAGWHIHRMFGWDPALLKMPARWQQRHEALFVLGRMDDDDDD